MHFAGGEAETPDELAERGVVDLRHAIVQVAKVVADVIRVGALDQFARDSLRVDCREILVAVARVLRVSLPEAADAPIARGLFLAVQRVADEMLRANWTAVLAVAKALEVKEQLTVEAVEKIMRQASEQQGAVA